MDTVRPYHHGDLRRHLVEAARAEVDEFGAEGVVLTRLASTCGVSVAAPYRHFVNRDALLAAVAAEGVGGVAAAGVKPDLRQLDPHAFTGRTVAGRHPAFLQAQAAGKVGLRILPIDRAKFLVNSVFDLRVEATGVDPATA